MDAITTKKLSMWTAMASLCDSEATVDIILGNIALILDDTTSFHEPLALAALKLISGTAAYPKCRAKLTAAGALKRMNTIAESGSSSAQRAARDVLRVLMDLAPTAAGSASASAGAAPSKRDLRGVQLNMDGLLGRRADEDLYIKALLMVDGVTSVTIDRKREVALVYTYLDSEMKSKLYDVVQGVCDQLQDAAGRPRKSVKAADHAAYLEEDDEAEDFFAAGGKGVLAKANQGAKKEKTADDRFKERSAAAAPAAAGGYLSGITSWLGF